MPTISESLKGGIKIAVNYSDPTTFSCGQG